MRFAASWSWPRHENRTAEDTPDPAPAPEDPGCSVAPGRPIPRSEPCRREGAARAARTASSGSGPNRPVTRIEEPTCNAATPRPVWPPALSARPPGRLRRTRACPLVPGRGRPGPRVRGSHRPCAGDTRVRRGDRLGRHRGDLHAHGGAAPGSAHPGHDRPGRDGHGRPVGRPWGPGGGRSDPQAEDAGQAGCRRRDRRGYPPGRRDRRNHLAARRKRLSAQHASPTRRAGACSISAATGTSRARPAATPWAAPSTAGARSWS